MTLPDTSTAQTLLQFFACVTIVWFSDARLAYLPDALSERYCLSKSLIELVFLALATSLPEVTKTLTATVKQTKDLVLNNLLRDCLADSDFGDVRFLGPQRANQLSPQGERCALGNTANNHTRPDKRSSPPGSLLHNEMTVV